MNFPHVRGGEPASGDIVKMYDVIFPTCVGVNRRLGIFSCGSCSFSPRAWG